METPRRDLVLVAVPAEWVHTLVDHGAGPGSPRVGWGPVLQVGREAEVLLAVDLRGPAVHRLAELLAAPTDDELAVAVLETGAWQSLPVRGLDAPAVARVVQERLGVVRG